jgi:hypothetical protein
MVVLGVAVLRLLTWLSSEQRSKLEALNEFNEYQLSVTLSFFSRVFQVISGRLDSSIKITHHHELGECLADVFALTLHFLFSSPNLAFPF